MDVASAGRTADRLPGAASNDHAKDLPARTGGSTIRVPRRRVMAVGLDLVVLALAGAFVSSSGWSWAASSVGLTVGLLAMTGQYSSYARHGLSEQLRTAVGVSAVGALTLAALHTGVGDGGTGDGLARDWIAATTGLVVIRVLLGMIDARRWMRGKGMQRVLIVGAGEVGRLAARRLAERPELGMEVVGFLDHQPRTGGERDPDVLGASWDLERVVADHRVDTVLVGFSTAPHHVLLRLVHRSWDLGAEVLMVPRLFEVEGTRSRTRHVGGLPLVALQPGVRRRSPAFRVKYLCEQFAAAVLLVLLAPLLAVIALLVRLSSPGPILHRASRMGQNGLPFEMLKFRTMTGTPANRGESDIDWAEGALRAANGTSPIVQLSPQPVPPDFCTPIGGFLRRTSLDELPQLWNVVRGEMSLVGPRPERLSYVELFSDTIYRYGERHRVRPGMTGWAQVQGLRGRTSLTDRVEWDNFYIENWSPWLDLKVVALTTVALWRGTGS